MRPWPRKPSEKSNERRENADENVTTEDNEEEEIGKENAPPEPIDHKKYSWLPRSYYGKVFTRVKRNNRLRDKFNKNKFRTSLCRKKDLDVKSMEPEWEVVEPMEDEDFKKAPKYQIRHPC